MLQSASHRGSLYLRVGPMFSGKSTWLNAELTQLADTGFKVLKIVHADDIRRSLPRGRLEECTGGDTYFCRTLTEQSEIKAVTDEIKMATDQIKAEILPADLETQAKSDKVHSNLSEMQAAFRSKFLTGSNVGLETGATTGRNCIPDGSTHNSSYSGLTPKIQICRAFSLDDIDVTDFHVIGIDESQFFPDLVATVTAWVEGLGKHVRVAGLDGDAFKQKFGYTLDLIPICDEVQKMHARCRFCLQELESVSFKGNIMTLAAPFSLRLDQSTVQKAVGGADLYAPVCRAHYASYSIAATLVD